MTNTQSPRQNDDQTITEAAAPGSRRKRTILVGTAAAVLLLGGGTAFAIGNGATERGTEAPVERSADGSSTADADDDRDDANDRDDADDANDTNDRDEANDADDKDDANGRDDKDDADDRTEDQAAGTAADLPASDAASLRDAADSALAETGAEGVTSIGVDPGVYEVEVQMADGTETDVLIAADGTITTSVDADDDKDATADSVLDLEQLPAIETAALDAAAAEGSAGGTLEEISASDDPGTAIEVGIGLTGGGEVDVDLDEGLAVVTVETEQAEQD